MRRNVIVLVGALILWNNGSGPRWATFSDDTTDIKHYAVALLYNTVPAVEAVQD